MKRLLKISIVGIASVTMMMAQGFDLMATGSIQKVGESPFFKIHNNMMHLYSNTNLVTPLAVVAGDTFVVHQPSKTTSVEQQQSAPLNFRLEQNYPNPFNMTTVVRYLLPEDADVTLKVYDITGREIETLVNTRQSAGVHSVGFGRNELSSGSYFYRLTAITDNGTTRVETKKMVVVK